MCGIHRDSSFVSIENTNNTTTNNNNNENKYRPVVETTNDSLNAANILHFGTIASASRLFFFFVFLGTHYHRTSLQPRRRRPRGTIQQQYDRQWG
mmetsp:Transcript_6598/g.10059  ORF Transcript_6598/g.10059 Transcript_6598/m.10059 type:complete len:95 (-) Transcript_6598:246-530(-)